MTTTRLYEKCPACEGCDHECRVCDGDGFVEHGRAQAREDHPVLDLITTAMVVTARYRFDDVRRESEGVTFADPATGRRFEVVVRAIDLDEEDDR